MEDHIFKKIEVVGTSSVSIDEAIRNAIRRASASVHHLRWFEVSEIRGDISGSEIAHFQVSLKVGFKVED
jgi:flavin-binding protein dodecin